MYFYALVKDKYKNNKVLMFVDMDGVIADYDIGNKLDFKNKRPLLTNINTIKEISNIDNIELFILSICKKDYQIEEKNDWLDKYAPYFKKENRIIVSKESNPNLSSAELKYRVLKKYYENNKNKKIVHIDDDNGILKYLGKELPNIDVYQDSSLLD